MFTKKRADDYLKKHPEIDALNGSINFEKRKQKEAPCTKGV
jgi:hypothetical protein